MKNPAQLEEVARKYCILNDFTITIPLGAGTDGCVWKTSVYTAIKVSEDAENYFRELACYERLKDAEVGEINGFNVPRLIRYDDDLLVIEMSIVKPPYILDFGKAYIDKQPPYFLDSIRMHEWEEAEKERWEERWPTVKKLVTALSRYGIYYLDLNQQNIAFPT